MIWYVPITILLAFIDWWRIRVQNKKNVRDNTNKDISHAISTALAVVGAMALCLVIYGWHFGWFTLIYIGVVTGIRGVLFDISLNLMRREKINYVSGTSTSQEEIRLNRIKFWWRRAMFAGLLTAVLIVKYVWL